MVRRLFPPQLLLLSLLVLKVLEAWTQGTLDHRATVRYVRGRIPNGGAHLADEQQEDDAEGKILRR